jgi:predicted aldo/keto reductase-like oxidoreductase
MGIGIPGIFVLEGYFSRYNLQDWALTRYNRTPVKASACIGCGACEARCPYQLPIRKMLKNVVKLMEK